MFIRQGVMDQHMTTPEEKSKFGVLVSDDVQADLRTLVKYENDGSVRNYLGAKSTKFIELGIAMYFWRNPDELMLAAQSEYVDNGEEFVERVKEYQNKHSEDLVLAADQRLLSGKGGSIHRGTTTSMDNSRIQPSRTAELQGGHPDLRSRLSQEAEPQEARSGVNAAHLHQYYRDKHDEIDNPYDRSTPQENHRSQYNGKSEDEIAQSLANDAAEDHEHSDEDHKDFTSKLDRLEEKLEDLNRLESKLDDLNSLESKLDKS